MEGMKTKYDVSSVREKTKRNTAGTAAMTMRVVSYPLRFRAANPVSSQAAAITATAIAYAAMVRDWLSSNHCSNWMRRYFESV